MTNNEIMTIRLARVFNMTPDQAEEMVLDMTRDERLEYIAAEMLAPIMKVSLRQSLAIVHQILTHPEPEKALQAFDQEVRDQVMKARAQMN